MNPSGFDQSGFVNRYHYFGNGDNNIPFLSNFVFDTMPYQHCCVYPSEDFGTVDIHIYTLCSSFYVRRPPQSCLNYVPPRTGIYLLKRVSTDKAKEDYMFALRLSVCLSVRRSNRQIRFPIIFFSSWLKIMI